VAEQRKCTHGAEVQRQKKPHEGHTSYVCSYIGVGGVSWIRGSIQVSTRRNERRQHTLATQPRAGVGRAMPEARLRTFDRASSANGAGGTRPHRRAPGARIPAGAATAGGSVAASVNVTLHDMGAMQRLTTAVGQVDIKVVQAIDGWPT
jgi:hypothetical protein